jgi:hypothetical protein
VLFAVAAFLVVGFLARAYRFRTGVWVPGWTGGISLLVIFALFAVAGVALGNPSWFETAFFVVVAAHVGFYLQMARTTMAGRWWQLWR